jgi:hypothetical protein
MEIVNFIRALMQSSTPPSAARKSVSPETARPTGSPPARQGDDVAEFSESALTLTRREDLTNLRAGLIDSVRRQIEEGGYESPEKLDVAVERLFAELNTVDIHI